MYTVGQIMVDIAIGFCRVRADHQRDEPIDPHRGPVRQSASSCSSRRSGMRGCQPPGAGRCITAPGKVSGSRRFYVIIRGAAWSGGAVVTATADAPFPPLADASRAVQQGGNRTPSCSRTSLSLA